MTMVLARRNDDWLLAAFAPHLNGCNLSINREPSTGKELFHLWRGPIRVQSHAPLDGVIFYPELRYRGYQVILIGGWSFETSEPILKCFIDLSLIRIGTQENIDKRVQELVDDGWAWDPREGAVKDLHVDELEKIEGSPPDGAF
jgi:hypothetical protein